MDCFGGRRSPGVSRCERSRGRVLAVVSVLVFLVGAVAVSAGPVDPAQVQQVTEAFLKVKTIPPSAASRPGTITAQGFAAGVELAPGGLREIRGEDGRLLAYVANLQPQGFVALAADRDIAPVIAYSFQCSFPDEADKQNPLSRMVRADMRLRAKVLAEHPELKTPEAGLLWDRYAAGQIRSAADGPFEQWPPASSTATGGWVETAWVQGAPYNKFCPVDPVDGAKTYVGCVATALAQVLNYHRICNVTFGPNDAYTMYSGMRMDADSALYKFPSFAELNRSVAAVRARYAGGADLNDVEAAVLSFASGVAVQMDYGSDGSGAPPSAVQQALLNKFGFYSAEMFGALAGESYLVLQENMINGLPALISIQPPDGFGGHLVVCDGYNTDGEYHLNWGWGASSPQKMTAAWYRLPTGFYPYESVISESVLNVQPQAPALQVNKASLDFYSLPGQTTEPQSVRIEANVDGVQVNSVSSPDGFVLGVADEFSNHLDAFTLARAQHQVTLQVEFQPARAGGYYGTLAIRYNDGKVRYVILRGWSFEAGTSVAAGEVSGTWTADKSPYLVNGDIAVPQDGALTIEPGVKVFFTGSYGLTVGKNATLVAKGTATAPIELTAWNRATGWAGLRFLNSGSDDVLSYCALSWAKKTAGLIPLDANDATAEEDSSGGAIYCSQSSPTLENCRLTNNQGDGGGAIYCVDSSPLISNTLMANNASLGGSPRCGGICVGYPSGQPELYHCTIVNNSPGGVFANSWDGMIMANSIVWGNEMYQIQTMESAPEVTFCDVEDGYPGEGNRSAEPGFVRPSAGPGLDYDGAAADWTLQNSSPCLNAGKGLADVPATDLAGAPRQASGVLDLGAYENQAELPLLTITPSVTADAGFVPVNDSGTVQLDLTNTGTQTFTVQSVSISGSSRAASPFTVAPVESRVLAPGESLPLEITFHPTQEAVYRSKLDVRSTASNGTRVQIALKGVGVAGTIVAGPLVSGTWKKANSPYVVTGDLVIGRNKTLTIEPGVTVKFAGHFGLTVGYRGTLRAVGTAQERIVFTALDQSEGWFGIRLINSSSEDVLQFCTLEYAKKPYTGGGGVTGLFGGAILCYCSEEDDPGFPYPCDPKIDSCLLTHNVAAYGGALACFSGPEATITKNLIRDNQADYYGGGVMLFAVGGTVANNVIVHNSALLGGALANMSSSPSIRNNTMAYNEPGALFLESAYMDYFGRVESASVTNNILWKNGIYLPEQTGPDDFRIRFNDIQGGWPGEGNIDQDPQFANPEADDFHLKSQAGRWDPTAQAWVVDSVTSLCIDAGDPTSSLGQEPTPNGQRIDMGAYGGTDQASKSPGSLEPQEPPIE